MFTPPKQKRLVAALILAMTALPTLAFAATQYSYFKAVPGLTVTANPPPAAQLALSTTALAYNGVTLGASLAQTVVVTNTGTVTTSLSDINVEDPVNFSSSSTCGASLAPAATCVITAMFNPSIPGYLASRLHLTSSASAEPTYVSLAGNGLQGLASYSSTSLLFAAQNVASTSDAQNVTITNDGTAPLTISGVHVDLGLANFNQNNNCAAPLGIGMSCAIAVAMTPSIAGPLTGRVLVSNNGSTGSGAISLSGSGLAIPATLGIFEVGDRQIGDAPSELVAPTSNSTGQWTYTSSNSGVVSMSGGTLTVVATGSAIITATQAANEKYTEGTRTTTTTVTLPLPNKIGDGISKVGACSAGQAGCAIMLPPPAGRISVVDSYEIYISNNSGWYLTTQASIGKSTGKWYWEATLKAHANGSYIYGCSVSPPEYSQYTLPGEGTNAPGYGYGADFGEGVGGVGTVYSCLLDLSSAQKTITSFRNGVRIGTHNISGSPLLYPSPTLYNQDRMKINLGQENFMYPVPLGYAAGVY